MADRPSGGAGSPILELSEHLAGALQRSPIPAELKKEDGLEREFIVREAEKILKRYGSKFEACAHPWRSKECCPKHNGQRQRLGCPVCWSESKPWASVHVWGMQHNFDLVVRDRMRKHDSLVVEGKLFSFENGQPNGEIQRFFGQCGLARTKHRAVIGFCGYRGVPREKFWQDTEKTVQWFRDAGVRVVFRKVD